MVDDDNYKSTHWTDFILSIFRKKSKSKVEIYDVAEDPGEEDAEFIKAQNTPNGDGRVCF